MSDTNFSEIVDLVGALNSRELDELFDLVQARKTACQLCGGPNGLAYSLMWRGWDTANRRTVAKAAGQLRVCDGCWSKEAAPSLRKHPYASAGELRDSLREKMEEKT